MLTNDFTNLDKKYISVKSKYLLGNDKENYLNSIKELAKEGQINALQDFFTNVSEYDMIAPEIMNHIVVINSKLRHNFEENYLLTLYAESKGLRSANTRHSDTCKQISSNLFSKDRNPVAFVRFAEICDEMNENDTKYAAIELARESFRKSLLEKNMSGNDKLAFLYSQLIFSYKFGNNKRSAKERLALFVEELSSTESV